MSVKGKGSFGGSFGGIPPGRRKDSTDSEAVTGVASHEDGGGREDHLEGGRGERRCVLPAG
jgi:hypothetical protein